MSVFQIVSLEAAEGKSDELRPMLEAGREFALTVDGCEGFEIYRSTEKAETFMMVERWATPEQHQKHFQANVVESGVAERVSALLAKPMEYGYFSQL